MKHLIKIESTPHGVLGVRHAGLDQQYCEVGELVILKWQPDAKWGLQEAHYTDGDGNVTPIDLKPVKVDGMDVVVFTMPDANITVGGTFKMFVSQDWTEGTNPSKGEVLTVGNNGEPTPISVDELANEIAEGDNNLVDSIDAINPFKGWYANLATLQASHPSPQVGDYAYVEDSGTTYIYRCSTDGEWPSTSTEEKDPVDVTFAGGEEVNETYIDDTHLVNPSSSALALAKDVNEYISYHFSFDGSISNTGNYDSNSSYKLTDYIVIQGGEQYYGYGNSATRGCVAFYDRNKTWISTLQPASGSMTKYTLDENTIPSNAVYFRAGTLNSYLAQSYIKQPVHSIAGNLDGFSKDIELVRNEVRKIDGYISSSDVTITNSQINLNIAFVYDHAYIMVKCDTTPPSDTFNIHRRTNYGGTANTYLSNCRYNEWIRVDKDDVKGNIFYIVANVSSSTVSIPMSIIFRSIEESIEDRLTLVENNSVSLKNKNIVVFGDSLSEFTHQGKGWIDYAEDISGANFINVAIGGTQIKQRYSKLPTLFDSTKTYNIGDWVFYKPSSTINCYECTAQHTGVWNDSDFTEVPYNSYVYAQLDIVSIISNLCNTSVQSYSDRLADTMACAQCIADHFSDNNTAQIQRLIDVDWSMVDAIIILAGANDFGISNFGNADSIDKMRESGAINEIVRMFSSTFKNIPIYYSSLIVRWFGYSEGTGIDANWCDVYHATEGSYTSELTYKGWTEAIINQFKLHHIPTIDLYNTLGWNKWNFSNFFTDNDGTHPYKGFRQIAEKIVSYIIANKVF